MRGIPPQRDGPRQLLSQLRPWLWSGAVGGVILLTILGAILLTYGDLRLAPFPSATVTQPSPTIPQPSLTLTPPPSPGTPTPVPPTSTSTPTSRPTAVPPWPTPTPTVCIIPSGWDWVYVVQPSDNIYFIAQRHGTTALAIVHANCLYSYYLFPGQRLFLPPPLPPTATPTPRPPTPTSTPCTPTPPDQWVSYVVQPGDTLYSLALRYGTSIQEIMEVNCLASDYLYAGQRLYLPPPPDTPTPTSTFTATATSTPTNTATASATATRTSTASATSTVTPTSTATPTATQTSTATATSTSTGTPSRAETPTATETPGDNTE